MNPTQIALTLPSDQVQYILNVLAERPFKEVGELIPLIMKQATSQVAAAQAPLASNDS
jgi:hypothetical protein